MLRNAYGNEADLHQPGGVGGRGGEEAKMGHFVRIHAVYVLRGCISIFPASTQAMFLPLQNFQCLFVDYCTLLSNHAK